MGRRMLGGSPAPKISGVVGYTQNYAIYVHENLEARHPNGGQAKYLVQPAREKKNEIAAIVRTALMQQKTLKQALTLGCLYLQRESMQLVPIDTGALRASAFTAIEEG